MAELSRRSGKNLVMVAAIVTLVIAAIGAGVVMRPRLQHRAEKGEGAKAHKSDQSEKGNKLGEHGEGEGEGETLVLSLGEFLVNLDNAGGEARYLRVEVSVRIAGLPSSPKKTGHGSAKGEGDSLPAGDMAVARDRVVAVLSAGVFSQLRSPAGRDGLKRKVQKALQEALPDYDITEVLFTSFVMQ